MRAVAQALTIILYFLFAGPANAGLFFCNNFGQQIAVAVGWKENDRWVAAGWRLIEPAKCAETLLGPLHATSTYYYYAEVVGTSIKFDAPPGEPGAKFCIQRSAFKIYDVPNCFFTARFREIDTNGQQQYTKYLSESTTDVTVAAQRCDSTRAQGADEFARCWIRQVSTNKQRRILRCLEGTKSKASLAICAYEDHLSKDAYVAATCASRYSTERNINSLLDCAAKVGLTDTQRAALSCGLRESDRDPFQAGSCLDSLNLDPEARRLYNCALQNRGGCRATGLCVARRYLTQDQQIVTKCVLDNLGRYSQMAICAVGNKLTPEQQAFASCAVDTGGEPLEFVACFATRLTATELEKCVTDGIGGSGCFGDNNTIVRLVNNAWRDVTEGPGPSNELLGRDGFIGRTAQNIANDLTYGPGENNDIVGVNGFVCTNILGGC